MSTPKTPEPKPAPVRDGLRATQSAESPLPDPTTTPELLLDAQEAASHSQAPNPDGSDAPTHDDPRWRVVTAKDLPKRQRTVTHRKYDDAVDAAFRNAPNALELRDVPSTAVLTIRRNYSSLTQTLPVTTQRPDLPGGELTEYLPHRITAFVRTVTDHDTDQGQQSTRKAVFIQAVPVNSSTEDTQDDPANPEDTQEEL